MRPRRTYVRRGRPGFNQVSASLDFINCAEEFVHGPLPGKLTHLLVRGLHLRDERFAVRDRDVHALLLKFLDGGGFTVRDLVARQILRLHGFFLQDLLHLGGQPVEEGLVSEEHLAVKIVVRERQLILRFVERVGEDREDGVFFTSDDALLQRRVELRIGNALRVGTDRVKRGEQPRRRRNANLDPLEVVGRVDDNALRRRLTEAVVEHRKAYGVVVFELLVHPAHHEAVDHLVRLIVVGEEERSRHRIELLRIHGHIAERHDREVESSQRHLLCECRLVAELARRVDLHHILALRAVLHVLSELQGRFVVHVRNVRRMGEADGRRRPGATRDGERKGCDGGRKEELCSCEHGCCLRKRYGRGNPNRTSGFPTARVSNIVEDFDDRLDKKHIPISSFKNQGISLIVINVFTGLMIKVTTLISYK